MKTCNNKAALARKMEVSRSTLYYLPKKPPEDEEIKENILVVLEEHPAYGHKRIALDLGYNKKKILRVMNKFGIRPKLLRGKPNKQGDMGKAATLVPNLVKSLCPIQPDALWAGDFTYLPWDGGFVYVATVLDVYTREIAGWHIGLRHTTDLVIEAFLDAYRRRGRAPQVFHSDQGSEYISGAYEKILENLAVNPSHSKKSSPWENGYQESFYNNFKLELGRANRFEDLGQLAEAIHQQICYYNGRRIHTALKMPPAQFKWMYYEQQKTAIQAI